MKKIICTVLSIAFVLSTFIVSAKKKHIDKNIKDNTEMTEKQNDGPFIKFKGGDLFDFGNIHKGDTKTHVFEFYNTGKKTLNIDNVVSYCKCINLEWDVEPILPGMKGHVKVTLKTDGLNGDFNKEIFILSNAIAPLPERRITLFIKGISLPDWVGRP